MSNRCKNCNNDLTGNYCSICGQSAHTSRINLHYIIHEFLHGVLHVDKGIIYTCKELTIRPGKTIRNYLSGKRVNYFKPFGYLFLLATIYTVMMHFLGVPIFGNYEIIESVEGDAPHETIEKLNTINSLSKSVFDFMNNHYAAGSLISLPIAALCTFLCFFSTKYNYGEHLVVNSYIYGQTIVASIILIPFSYYFPEFNLTIASFTLFALKIYMVVCVFNQYKLPNRIIRAIGAFMLEYLIVIFIITAGLLIVLFL